MEEMKFYSLEFIEAYLKSDLSDEEHQAMEKCIAKDSQLASEVALQRDIQEAIARTRRAELKQLLQNTPLPATSAWFAKPVHWFLVGGVFSLAVLIAVRIFTPNEKPSVMTNSIENTQNSNSLQNLNTIDSNFKNEQSLNNELRKVDNQQPINTNEQSNKNEFLKPSPELIKDIFYQYDGKSVLQIFGNFDYEILENITLDNGELKTYIFVQNKFYELIPTQEDEVRNLKENEVKDKALIRLLSEKLKNK